MVTVCVYGLLTAPIHLHVKSAPTDQPSSVYSSVSSNSIASDDTIALSGDDYSMKDKDNRSNSGSAMSLLDQGTTTHNITRYATRTRPLAVESGANGDTTVGTKSVSGTKPREVAIALETQVVDEAALEKRVTEPEEAVTAAIAVAGAREPEAKANATEAKLEVNGTVVIMHGNKSKTETSVELEARSEAKAVGRNTISKSSSKATAPLAQSTSKVASDRLAMMVHVLRVDATFAEPAPVPRFGEGQEGEGLRMPSPWPTMNKLSSITMGKNTVIRSD